MRLDDQPHRAEPAVEQLLLTPGPQLAAKVGIDQMAGRTLARAQVRRALTASAGTSSSRPY